MSVNKKVTKRDGVRFENNLNAPRMRHGKYNTKLITKELYEAWYEKTSFKEVNTFEKFKKIWKDMIVAEMLNEIRINPEGVRMGKDTGDLRLNYTKKSKPPLDEKGSSEAGKDVPALNWNTNQKTGKFVWSIDAVRKKNKRIRLFAFIPKHEVKHLSSLSFKETPEIYKDNRLSKYQKKKIKDANNPWIHGMEILNKKPVEPINYNKRSYFDDQEGS